MANETKLAEDFPGRAKLEEAGLTTTEAVAAKSDEELIELDGIGPATVADIRKALDAPAEPASTPDKEPAKAPARSSSKKFTTQATSRLKYKGERYAPNQEVTFDSVKDAEPYANARAIPPLPKDGK